MPPISEGEVVAVVLGLGFLLEAVVLLAIGERENSTARGTVNEVSEGRAE
jgi:hypothetical protein